jgi:hypothetical protein
MANMENHEVIFEKEPISPCVISLVKNGIDKKPIPFTRKFEIVYQMPAFRALLLAIDSSARFFV